MWDLHVGMVWEDEFEEGGRITSNGTFTAKPFTGEVVMIESEMYLDEAMDLAKSLTNMGYDAYASYLMDQEWTEAACTVATPTLVETFLTSTLSVTLLPAIGADWKTLLTLTGRSGSAMPWS